MRLHTCWDTRTAIRFSGRFTTGRGLHRENGVRCTRRRGRRRKQRLRAISIEGVEMMSADTANGSGRVDVALLLIRVASAAAFLYHGSAILFGAFGGPGPAGFAGFLQLPLAAGYLVGLAQLGGGLAMLTGVFVRVGAVCITIVMVGAIF